MRRVLVLAAVAIAVTIVAVAAPAARTARSAGCRFSGGYRVWQVVHRG